MYYLFPYSKHSTRSFCLSFTVKPRKEKKTTSIDSVPWPSAEGLACSVDKIVQSVKYLSNFRVQELKGFLKGLLWTQFVCVACKWELKMNHFLLFCCFHCDIPHSIIYGINFYEIANFWIILHWAQKCVKLQWKYILFCCFHAFKR